jgi:pimeloyl-ACP methyl ester carboxylesterase
MQIAPFTVPYSQKQVEDLRARLSRTRWPQRVPGEAWEYGTEPEFLKELCAYWAKEFNWRAQVTSLSALPHFLATTGDTKIHFIHLRGKGPAPFPLIVTHGWPGSFLEMLHLLPLITDPAEHGGDASDAFDVVIPSLPGFGYSSIPTELGTNASRVADLWTDLMLALGYDKFGAQGGDIGAGVTTAMALRHPAHLAGIHLNYIPGSYRPHLAEDEELSPIEAHFLKDAEHWYETEGAYGAMQRSRPQTAGYSLNDSPAGLAAWIVEKFRSWSDCDGDVYRKFSKDELLANITLYWMTETITSSFAMYAEGRRAPMHFREGEFVGVPTAVARFPKESPFPPRAWVDRGYNVVRWTEMPRGGHFAAAEEPELLAEDLHTFFRQFRAR